MRELKLSADKLIDALLELSKHEDVSVLDSCGVSHQGSHKLIAGIRPIEKFALNCDDPKITLDDLGIRIFRLDLACVFTISYDFGLKLEGIKSRKKEFESFAEPDIFLAAFDVLVVHDYSVKKTYLTGNENRFDEFERIIFDEEEFHLHIPEGISKVTSNLSRKEYVEKVKTIQEFIRNGDTYQTNLTQQFKAEISGDLTPQLIFQRLRDLHPAPFSAFIKREDDFVVSISPERFVKIQNPAANDKIQIITASPIKGTRPRGKTNKEDHYLRNQLLTSEKDRAENVMIVDLLRNDIGRVCEFGSVEVEKLCELETHPTFFHLVSTIRGTLCESVGFAEIIKAIFPCGSIVGAPKIRTMQLIDELETANRGLSMGAIGCFVPDKLSVGGGFLDMSVAIRTMVICDNVAKFNVGGAVVIDSDPESEYQESLLKAKAIFSALNASFP